MRVHVIKHVPFEGPGTIADWAHERGYRLTESESPIGEFPDVSEVDLLVVMGGPMDADDHDKNPWLADEKRYVAKAIDEGLLVLGVCLGAQILAEVVGGRVKRCEWPEIGWFPVRRTEHSKLDPLFAVFPEVLVVGHWHSDTFDLPEGVMPVLSSDACPNQAFTTHQGRVVGLQFHLEWTREGLEALVDECMDELVDGGPYLTTATEMMAAAERHMSAAQTALRMLLDLMVALPEGRSPAT